VGVVASSLLALVTILFIWQQSVSQNIQEQNALFEPVIVRIRTAKIAWESKYMRPYDYALTAATSNPPQLTTPQVKAMSDTDGLKIQYAHNLFRELDHMSFLVRYGLISDQQLLHAFRTIAFSCWTQFNSHYVDKDYPEFEVYGKSMQGMKDFYQFPKRYRFWPFNGGYFSKALWAKEKALPSQDAP